MSDPGPPGVGELIDRIRHVDQAALEATARGFDDAAGGLDAQRGRIHASVAVAMPQWRGKAATAWQQHLALTASRLHAAAGALRETGTVLRELARESESARVTLDQARALQVQGYELPDQLEGLAEAQRQAEAATASYHAAEQRLRARLWEIGDRAPVAPPPVPPLPSVPPIPLWARALGERAPTWYWDRGLDGQALGWDEDGNVVSAARGHPRTFELTEMGFGGLLKVLPGVARRAPVNPRTAEELVPAFREVIEGSYAWRDAHRLRHVREWFRLPPGAEVPAWMDKEYLDLVARASAEQGTSKTYNVFGKATHLVLKYDQETKRQLVVPFHASGPRAGEFATSFIPSERQLAKITAAANTTSAP
jgi:uncharacterized protein YukE